MPKTTTLDETTIRALASPQSFERGRAYRDGGAVSGLVRRGDTVTAEVEGSDPDPYGVTLHLDAEGVGETRCTCPYEWGGACKHVVAVLLTLIEAPDAIVERPSLKDLLGGLERPALAALLLKRAALDPDLAGWIEAELAAAPGRGGPPDPAPIAERARAVLAGRYRPRNYWDDYRPDGDVSELRDLVDKAVPLMEAGDGRGALRVLEAVADAFVDDWILHASGTDEHLYALFDDLGRMMAEAALMSDLDGPEREAMVETVEEWQDRLSDHGVEEAFALTAHALRVGWDAPGLQAVLAGEEGATWPPSALIATVFGAEAETDADESSDEAWDESSDESSDESWDDPGAGDSGTPDLDDEATAALRDGVSLERALTGVRLRVLDAAGRHDAYLHLARAAGAHAAAALMLVRLDRIAEAVARAGETFTSPSQSLDLARALARAERGDEAFAVAEAGLSLGTPSGAPYRPGGAVAPLARWLREAAMAAGRTELGLRAARAAFGHSLARDDFRAARAPAGADWDGVRGELLAALIAAERARDRVEILLDEGLVDEAVTSAGEAEGHETAEETLLRLLEAAQARHCDWVIRVARRRADAIMEQGQAGLYPRAAEWLRRAALAHESAGRIDAWSATIEGLIERHRRKYKLRPLLEDLRF